MEETNNVHEKENASAARAESRDLEEIWSNIYENRAHGTTAEQWSSLFPPDILEHHAKSTLQLSHIKKRTAKAKKSPEKAVYDLANGNGRRTGVFLEGNDNQLKQDSVLTNAKQVKTTSSGVFSKAIGTLEERDDDTSEEADEEHRQLLNLNERPMSIDMFTTLEETSMRNENHALSKESPKAKENDQSDSSDSSVDEPLGSRRAHEDLEEVAKGGGAGDEKFEKNYGQDEFDTSGKHETKKCSASNHEPKKGTSLLIAKLFDENVELAKTLAATRSELERARQKLEQMTNERDEIIATAYDLRNKLYMDSSGR